MDSTSSLEALRVPFSTKVSAAASAAASPRGAGRLLATTTRSTSFRTGIVSAQEHSFWSAYSSIVLNINSTCFVTAADLACAAATVLVVGALIVTLVVLTEDDRRVPGSRQLEAVIRGPFGVLRGVAQLVAGQGYAYSFLGVPFAQPLSQRFSPSVVRTGRQPANREHTTVVLNASYTRPACIQPLLPGDKRAMSEDCLHLNIWTPHPNCTERNLPECGSRTVLFFLHGDNFQEGGNNDPLLDARHLAVLGDVVVVVPNYRLGALGFLVGGTAETSGNAGLGDQLTALKWVQKHIGYFGGNSSDVVAVGHGAGAASIGLLLFKRQRKPNFDRVILMSHGPFCRYPDSTSSFRQLLTDEAARHAVCSNTTSSPLECLQREVRAAEFARPGWPRFFPTFGGDLLEEPPSQLATRVQLRGLAVLIGHADDERERLLEIVRRQYQLTSETSGTPYLPEVLSAVGISTSSIATMIDFYRQRYLQRGNIGRWRAYSVDILVDMLVVCPQRYFVDYLLAGGGNRVYRFLLGGANSGERVGSLDAVEMLFGKHLVRQSKESLKRLSLRIIQLWTDFAKNRHVPEVDKEIYDEYALTLSDVTFGNSSIDTSGRLDLRKPYCDFLKPHYISEESRR